MNKKGFTLIELLAVLVILSIVSLIAVPNYMNSIETQRKKLYITDAVTFKAEAKTYYDFADIANYEQNNFISLADGSVKIMLKDIPTIDKEKDPFGYYYDLDNSYVLFSVSNDNDPFKKIDTKIYLKSCDKEDKNKCYCLYGDANKLSSDLITDNCTGVINE